jgi:hypothetical protein
MTVNKNIHIAKAFCEKVQEAFDKGHTLRLHSKYLNDEAYEYYHKDVTINFGVWLDDYNELYLMDNYFGCVTDTDEETLRKRFANLDILVAEPIKL